MIEKIDTGACVALVDAVAGAGVMMHLEVDDVRLPGLHTELPGGLIGRSSGSLAAASRDAMLARLFRDGWEIDEDDDGLLRPVATDPNGNPAFALWPKSLDVKHMSNGQFDQVYAEWENHVRTLLASLGDDWKPYEG